MQYQVGKTGRVVIARFSDGDDVLEGLVKISSDEEIRAAVFWLVGGIKGGSAVVGPESEDEMPPKPMWWRIGESHEVVAAGTIFYEGETPKVHLHGAFGKRDTARVGCLRKDSEAFLVLEAVIMEVQGVTARRELDPSVGLPLLKL